MITNEERRLAGMLPFKETPSTRYHHIRPSFVDLSLNYNNMPHKSNAVIICTSHRGHLAFLRHALRQYRETGKFVICAYDPPQNPWDSDDYFETNMPDKSMFLAAHAWVYKHITYENEKRNGWYWDVRYAQGIVRNFEYFEYIFTVNGDYVWEKPEGVDELIALMGDADLMAVTSDHNTIHTCAVLYRRKAFMDIMDYMSEYHKISVIGSHSPEKLLIQAVKALGLKELKVSKQPIEPEDERHVDHYTRYRQPNTWNDIVGYRNIGAEWLTALIEGKEPPEKKFFQFRHFDAIWSWCTSHVKKYYETDDRRYLHMSWDWNEDSWYDRVDYPLEYYGPEPILEKEE